MAKTLKLNDVSNFIFSATYEDMRVLSDAMKMRRNQLTQVAKSTFKVGQKVKFMGKTRGLHSGLQRGIITKINAKRAVVMVNNSWAMKPVKWTVPFTLLEIDNG